MSSLVTKKNIAEAIVTSFNETQKALIFHGSEMTSILDSTELYAVTRKFNVPSPYEIFDGSNATEILQYYGSRYEAPEEDIFEEFIRELDKHGHLLRVYTQNVSGTLQDLGEKMVSLYGNIMDYKCNSCNWTAVKNKSLHIDTCIRNMDRVIMCPHCRNEMFPEKGGMMVPQVSIDLERIHPNFDEMIKRDLDECTVAFFLNFTLDPRLPKKVTLIPICIPEGIYKMVINRNPIGSLAHDEWTADFSKSDRQYMENQIHHLRRLLKFD